MVSRVLWDIETTGLNPRKFNKRFELEPRITCISYKINRREIINRCGENEIDIIKLFIHDLSELRKWSRVFGINTHGFDFRYLVSRAEQIFDDNYLSFFHDILRLFVWRDLQRPANFEKGRDVFLGKTMSARDLAEYYGVENTVKYTGKDCLLFAKNGRYDLIKEHCESDIVLLDNIIKAICKKENTGWKLL